MRAESLEAMRVGSREKRLAALRSDLAGAAIEVEQALVEVADLDRVEAIDFLKQPLPDRSAKKEKWMRRKTKKRLAATGSELAEIGESAQIFDLVRPNVQQDHVRSLEPHLGCLDEQNSHRRGVGENFRSIEDLVMQRNCERAETEVAGSLEQLMRGIIEMIFRIVERVDVEIDFDPVGFALAIVLLHLRHHKCSFCALLGTSSACTREREFEHEHDYERRVARKTSLLAFPRS